MFPLQPHPSWYEAHWYDDRPERGSGLVRLARLIARGGAALVAWLGEDRPAMARAAAFAGRVTMIPLPPGATVAVRGCRQP